MTEEKLCGGKTFKEVMQEVDFCISDKQRIEELEKENAELKLKDEKLYRTLDHLREAKNRKQKRIEVLQEGDVARFEVWHNRLTELEKENAELKKDKEYLDKVSNEQTEVILKLNEQIEKMKHCWNCEYRKSGNHRCVDCESVSGKRIIRKNWELAE